MSSPLARQMFTQDRQKREVERGKFDANRTLSDGSLMQFAHIYPMDAVFDTPADVPEDVSAVPVIPRVTHEFWQPK